MHVLLYTHFFGGLKIYQKKKKENKSGVLLYMKSDYTRVYTVNVSNLNVDFMFKQTDLFLS